MRAVISDWIDLPEGVKAETPCFALSDVHGFSGFMRMALNHVSKISTGHEMVFLGDLIDRGPDSLGCVRECVNSPANAAFSKVRVIRGNHCEVLRHFVKNPKNKEAKDALVSMGGRGLIKQLSEDKGGHALCKRYVEMSQKSHLNGGVLFVHATPDPSKRLSDQSSTDLFWSTKFLEYKGGWERVLGRSCVLSHGHVHHGINGATISETDLTKRYANIVEVFHRVPLDAKTPKTHSITVAEFVDDKFRVHAVS